MADDRVRIEKKDVGSLEDLLGPNDPLFAPTPAPVRTSYAAGLQLLIERHPHTSDCNRTLFGNACTCGVDTDIALSRSLAALIEEAERLKQTYGTIPGVGRETHTIVTALAAGFTAPPSLDGGAQG